MPECDSCGHTVDEEANYCPNCGAPQQGSVKKRQIIGRVSYAVGFLIIVAGVSMLPGNLGGIPIVIGGIQLFPPSRQALARVFGRPPKIWANAVFALIWVLIGGIIWFLL